MESVQLLAETLFKLNPDFALKVATEIMNIDIARSMEGGEERI